MALLKPCRCKIYHTLKAITTLVKIFHIISPRFAALEWFQQWPQAFLGS
jgi:hypothetical protein